MKNILITGAKSYVGDSVRNYLMQYPNDYTVDVIDTLGLEPEPKFFESYDVVFNVAGIAHIKETKENRHLYYDINRDLVIRIAKAAREGGVKQFILLSTMSVYGLTTGHITKETIPHPNNSYGESKLQADEQIRLLENDAFLFACLRPPMVYGKGCKGNYQSLRKFALKSPFFPNYQNERSMIYIGNLAEFVKCCIDEEKRGLFFPQNSEYTKTSEMVSLIAQNNGKDIRLTKAFNCFLKLPANVLKKVFGNLTYEKTDTISLFDFNESVRLTEGK